MAPWVMVWFRTRWVPTPTAISPTAQACEEEGRAGLKTHHPPAPHGGRQRVTQDTDGSPLHTSRKLMTVGEEAGPSLPHREG